VAARGDVLLFGHGHILRVLAVCWLGLEPRDARLLALSTASIGILGEESATRVLRAWNLGGARPRRAAPVASR
jgi:probable phosphoglycerate mutase